jgi:hypothetical protein
MKAYGGVGVLIHVFFPSALVEVSGQLHAPAALSPRKGPQVPIEQEAGWAPEPIWTWRKFLPLPGLELQPQLLYRLSYPGSMISSKVTSKLYVNIFIL